LCDLEDGLQFILINIFEITRRLLLLHPDHIGIGSQDGKNNKKFQQTDRAHETGLILAMARASRGPSPQVSGRPDVSRESSASHQTGRDGLALCGGSRSPGVLNL